MVDLINKTGAITSDYTTTSTGIVELNCSGYGTVGIDIRGTFTATLVVKASIDNQNFTTIYVDPIGGGAAVNSITSAGAWTVASAGYTQIQVYCSAYTSGTANVHLVASLDAKTATNVSVSADTELPTAAALADNATNPTTSKIGSCGMVYDGSTWDMQRGDATNGTLVNLGTNNDVTLATLPDTVTGDLATIAGKDFATQTTLATIDADTSALAETVKVEDAGHSTGDKGIFLLGVRKDTPAALAGTDLDYSPITTDVSGKLWSRCTGAGSHDSTTLETYPVICGFEAVNTDGTAPPNQVSAEGDTVRAIATRAGIQIVSNVHPNFWSVSADYSEAQTNASVKASPGAGLRLYITDIFLSNGATAGNVTLLQGSGGTVMWECYPAINGGANLNLRTPIVLTADTALCITSTTVTTHSITVSGYIAP